MKKDAQDEKRDNLVEIKYMGETGIRNMTAYAEKLVSAAHAAAVGYSEIVETEKRLFSQRIHKGFFAITASHKPDTTPAGSPPEDYIPDKDVTTPEC